MRDFDRADQVKVTQALAGLVDADRRKIVKMFDLPRLDYDGRELMPVPSNVSLEVLGMLLGAGMAAHIRLEPGDGTRYEFILVPQHTGPARVPGNPRDSILLMRTVGGEPGGSWLLTSWDKEHTLENPLAGIHEVTGAMNEHTRRVICWFRHVVFAAMEDLGVELWVG